MNIKASKGSIHVVIVICLAAALIGTLGFVYYRNFVSKDSTSRSATNASNTQGSTSSTGPVETTTPESVIKMKDYCLPNEKLCFTMSATYATTYAAKPDQLIASMDSPGVDDETVTFHDDSGSVLGEAKTFFGQFGGACDVSFQRTFRIVSVDVTEIKTQSPRQFESESAYVVKVARPDENQDGSYRAIVFLTTQSMYHKIGDISSCPNTFYGANITARNTKYSGPFTYNNVMSATLQVTYEDGAIYKSIDEAVKQLSTSKYEAAYSLFKTAHY